MKFIVDVTLWKDADPIAVADALLDLLGREAGEIEHLFSINGVEPDEQSRDVRHTTVDGLDSPTRESFVEWQTTQCPACRGGRFSPTSVDQVCEICGGSGRVSPTTQGTGT